MSEISKTFTTQRFEAVYKVDEEHDGIRLDQFCATFLESFSRNQIKHKIAAGEVRISKRPFPHKPSVKVYHNEIVTIHTLRGSLEDEYWRGEKLELELSPDVVYEDDNLLVVSKPPYMTTHPTGKHLFNCATVFFEEKLGHTIHSIHRLDRETSGIQVLGKNPKSAERFSKFFEEDKVSKVYFLIAHKKRTNIVFPFTATERLGSRDDFVPRLFVHCFPKESSKGKSAQTSFELLMENEDYILALAFPKTGRQHQIRAHAAFHGFPLLGDKLYNGDPTVFMRFKDDVPTEEDFNLMQISRHALHAIALEFPYPDTDSSRVFQAEIPLDLRSWICNEFKGIEPSTLDSKIKSLLLKTFSKK